MFAKFMGSLLGRIAFSAFILSSIVGLSILSAKDLSLPDGDTKNAVSFLSNSLRTGDVLEKEEVLYSDTGNRGENLFWDFTSKDAVNEYQVRFFCDSDSVIVYGMESMRLNKYIVRNDSLLLTGYETPQMSMCYEPPILEMIYPFSYGDNYATHFNGSGIYCGKHVLETSGTIHVTADADGSLSFVSGDTIHNILRLHVVRSESKGMYDMNDTIRTEEDNRKQEIEERYLWYAKGYRYPVYETISLTCYDNMTQVSCRQRAFRYLPESLIVDSTDEKIEEEDEGSAIQPEHAQSQIIDYNVRVSGRQVIIQYDLTETASLTTLVCNRMGYVYKCESATNVAGSDYMLSIDCNGLQGGIYILYLNVSGQVYSEKVNLP